LLTFIFTPLDYAVYIRETTKPWKVFLWTWSGLFFSQFLIEILGAALMTSINGSDAFTAAYNARGVGGLTGQIFEGYGTGVRNFGKFIEAILSFSVVAVVITNIYSLGLNLQIVSNYLIIVPRLIWSAIGGVAFLVRKSLCSKVFFSQGMSYRDSYPFHPL
jgi:purine-cytosine permease-like protein